MVEMEASGRLPIIWLVGNGAVWLFIALVLLLIDSLKLHLPSLLAGDAFWTYGRVRDAYMSSLLYGFAVQWALAGSLWLLCHVGRARVVAPGIIAVGAFVWETALTIGVVAILCGQSTGFESLAMPGYLAPVLLSAYLLMGICAALTFHDRREGALYPSQWFVLGALFWFPWIFSTAILVLPGSPVRGVLQASIAWWYGHNFSAVFIGFAGLGAIFYFVPKFSGRPLNSYYLAALAFWVIAFFGGWGGIPTGAPLPSWIPSLGVAGTVLSSVAVLAVARNFYLTTRGAPCPDGAARFILAGLIFWLLASVQEIAGVLPCVSAVTDFTWYWEAEHELFYYGFFSDDVVRSHLLLRAACAGFEIRRGNRAWKCAGKWRGAGRAAGRGGRLETRVDAGALLAGVLRRVYWLAVAAHRRRLAGPFAAKRGEHVCLDDAGHAAGHTGRHAGHFAVAGRRPGFSAQLRPVALAVLLPLLQELRRDLSIRKGAPMNSGPSLFLGLFLAMAISWLAFVLEPQMQIGSLQQTNTVAVGAMPVMYPVGLPGDADQGAEVYRANGCAACHTQQARPNGDGNDLARGWGRRRSVADDYIYDQPVMLGSQRVGPDLANAGLRMDANAVLARLYNPRALLGNGASIMPPYPYLFEKRKIRGVPSSDALRLPPPFAPPPVTRSFRGRARWRWHPTF